MALVQARPLPRTALPGHMCVQAHDEGLDADRVRRFISAALAASLGRPLRAVSYTHLRAHETSAHL
eukprot:9719272-Alexandrium_andersonii.AAC.1